MNTNNNENNYSSPPLFSETNLDNNLEDKKEKMEPSASNNSSPPKTKKSFSGRIFIVLLALLAITLGLGFINNMSNIKKEMQGSFRLEMEKRLGQLESKYDKKLNSLSVDMLDMESTVGTISSKINSIDNRLKNTEGIISIDKKKRAQAELQKILISLQEFSRFAEREAKQKVSAISDVLVEMLVTPKGKQSQKIEALKPKEENISLRKVQQNEKAGKENTITPKKEITIEHANIQATEPAVLPSEKSSKKSKNEASLEHQNIEEKENFKKLIPNRK